MTNQIEKAEKSPQALMKNMLKSDRFQEAIMEALPETGCTPARFAKVALTILTKTPKIGECTQASVTQCLIDCASLGIEPDGRRAHLIPYGKKCTLILDYKGIVELVRRSGDVKDVQAHVVHENDFFDYILGTGSFLSHKPAISGRGQPICAYSCVTMKDGSVSFEIMNVEEINAVRDDSQGYKSAVANKKVKEAIWTIHWPAMARKTVFKRHSKWLTLSPEVRDAIDLDNRNDHLSHEERAAVARPVNVAGAETIFKPEEPEVVEEEAEPPKPTTSAQVKLLLKALKSYSITMERFEQWADHNKHGAKEGWMFDTVQTFIDNMPEIAQQILPAPTT